MSTSRLLRAIGLAALAFSTPLMADQPQPAPAKHEECSPDKAFCAVADPQAHSISVFARGSAKPSWTLGSWKRNVFLANGGEHLVICPDGGSLLPLDTTQTDPLLTFMKRGSVVHIVRVGDLYPDLSALQRTSSHLLWGHLIGISPRNQLVVTLASGRRVAFNVSTGSVEPEK
jgi:hypothetical protein